MKNWHIAILYVTLCTTLTAVVIEKATEKERCRGVVLADIKKTNTYVEQLRAELGSLDFLTEMTRGQK